MKNIFGEDGLHRALEVVSDLACRSFRLAFKMAPEDLRLFFDRPFVKAGATLAGLFHGIARKHLSSF